MPLVAELYEVGTFVRVTKGTLAGLTGVVIETRDDIDRVVIEADFLQRGVKVVLDSDALAIARQNEQVDLMATEILDAMSRFDELDQQLAVRGWHYDAAREEFRNGTRTLEWEDAIGVVPDFTLDELARYQDHKNDERLARLAKQAWC